MPEIEKTNPENHPELMEDPARLAGFGGWQEEVYQDLLAFQAGELTEDRFNERYLRQRAILVLDLTGFTQEAMHAGSLSSFLRILNAEKVLIPILLRHGASRVHAFADDLVAIFDEPGSALDAALEIHQTTRNQKASSATPEGWPDCCIGIGWGPVYTIGPNQAMGDEMNRTSKLGEDTARGGETLVTENVRLALHDRRDVVFEPQSGDDLLFPYYRVARTQP